MAPNKSDNYIKNVLEERTILPSEKAWSKLEMHLNKEDKKSKVPWLWLSGLAATLVGVLLMINLLSKKTTNKGLVVTPNQLNKVKVNNPEGTTEMLIDKKDSFHFKSINSKRIKEQNVLVSAKTPESKTNNISKLVTEIKKKTSDSERVNADNFNAKKIERPEVFSNSIHTENDIVLNGNVVKITTQTVNAEPETMTEAEKLLAEAFAVIENEKPQSEIIDALSLLEDVEFELEESFRFRIFKKIKTNAISIKNTLVGRNK